MLSNISQSPEGLIHPPLDDWTTKKRVQSVQQTHLPRHFAIQHMKKTCSFVGSNRFITSHLVVHFVHQTSEQTQIYLARSWLALLIHQRVASMFRPAALSTLAPPLALLSTRRQEKRPSFLRKKGEPLDGWSQKKVKLMDMSCITIICFPSIVFSRDWWFRK